MEQQDSDESSDMIPCTCKVRLRLLKMFKPLPVYNLKQRQESYS